MVWKNKKYFNFHQLGKLSKLLHERHWIDPARGKDMVKAHLYFQKCCWQRVTSKWKSWCEADSEWHSRHTNNVLWDSKGKDIILIRKPGKVAWDTWCLRWLLRICWGFTRNKISLENLIHHTLWFFPLLFDFLRYVDSNVNFTV